MWFIFALIAGGFYTGSNLLARRVLKSGQDAWAYSSWFSAIGVVVTIPFLVGDYLINDKLVLPGRDQNGLWAWGLTVLMGFAIVLHNYLSFKASNYIEASLSGTITKFRLIWVLILGVLLLDESLSAAKLIGTLLTFLAGVTVLAKYYGKVSIRGIVYSFLATIIYAIVLVCTKFLLDFYNAWTITFFIFFIPMILNFILMPNSFTRVIKLFSETKWFLISGTALGGLANLAQNSALMSGEATKVPAIIESFLIITLVGEHVFLRERSNLKTKIIAVILATIGAVLIRLG